MRNSTRSKSCALRWLTVVALASLAAGCAGGSVVSDKPEVTATAAPSPAPADMAGRWALSAMGATCAVNLGLGGPSEGGVRPEGGCAGKFYTIRKWTYENNALVLRDHTGKPLAQLSPLAPGRFEGQAASGGHPVALVR